MCKRKGQFNLIMLSKKFNSNSLTSQYYNFWAQKGRLGGWGVGWCEGAPTHMHMHTHACTYDIIGNSQGFSKWGQPFAIEIIMFNVYVHACACMHACAHVLGVPQPPPSLSTHPTPRAAGSPKNQNSITLELIKIFRFCLKILYL